MALQPLADAQLAVPAGSTFSQGSGARGGKILFLGGSEQRPSRGPVPPFRKAKTWANHPSTPPKKKHDIEMFKKMGRGGSTPHTPKKHVLEFFVFKQEGMWFDSTPSPKKKNVSETFKKNGRTTKKRGKNKNKKKEHF